MAQRNFTLMIVPDTNARVRRVQVGRGVVYGGLLLLLAVIGGVGVQMVHYAHVIHEVFEAETLREENEALRGRLAELSDKIENIDTRLQTLRTYDEKLRSMTELNDSSRALAMGPVQAPGGKGGAGPGIADPFAVPIGGDDPSWRQLEEGLLDGRLYSLASEANHQLRSLSELVDYFAAREALLASTPSVWPARGWVTSTFGQREDPFTGEKIMHAGIDVAAAVGTQVVAPAKGVVIYAGGRGAYGNMVAIDHGRGIVTHYAHLHRILVKVGDSVERGQHIGAVGNTGRSTGPHLHYEVRVDGVPVNPRRFVLD